MMIARDLTAKLKAMVATYPVTTLTGPRQSGKSTLLKATFPDYEYVSLEDIDTRLFAQSDPRGFLATYPGRAIFDEAQRVPDLFSYIQTHVDKADEAGTFILAGSNNFLLMEAISQSLAGRTAILKLLPFSHREMGEAAILPKAIDEEIFTGGYPRIFNSHIAPTDFYPFYIQTYIEKDVLKPDHNNYSKRLVKTPKLYFHDTGLACSLLDIRSAEQVSSHFLRGGLFENMVVNEFIKGALNVGTEPELTFWRDKTGNEVDLLRRDGDRQIAYEIKSGATFSTDYFANLGLWARLSAAAPEQCNVIYGGEKSLKTSQGEVISWNNF